MSINSVSFLVALLIHGTAGLANVQCTKHQATALYVYPAFPVTSLLQQSRLFLTQNWRPPASPAKSPRFPSRTAMPSHRSRITATILATRPRSDPAITTHHSPLGTTQIKAPSFIAEPRKPSRPQIGCLAQAARRPSFTTPRSSYLR